MTKLFRTRNSKFTTRKENNVVWTKTGCWWWSHRDNQFFNIDSVSSDHTTVPTLTGLPKCWHKLSAIARQRSSNDINTRKKGKQRCRKQKPMPYDSHIKKIILLNIDIVSAGHEKDSSTHRPTQWYAQIRPLCATTQTEYSHLAKFNCPEVYVGYL